VMRLPQSLENRQAAFNDLGLRIFLRHYI
jgi:hypothetical protein